MHWNWINVFLWGKKVRNKKIKIKSLTRYCRLSLAPHSALVAPQKTEKERQTADCREPAERWPHGCCLSKWLPPLQNGCCLSVGSWRSAVRLSAVWAHTQCELFEVVQGLPRRSGKWLFSEFFPHRNTLIKFQCIPMGKPASQNEIFTRRH